MGLLVEKVVKVELIGLIVFPVDLKLPYVNISISNELTLQMIKLSDEYSKKKRKFYGRSFP
jgi:hypothetical protein